MTREKEEGQGTEKKAIFSSLQNSKIVIFSAC